jgi:hypothetical protein
MHEYLKHSGTPGIVWVFVTVTEISHLPNTQKSIIRDGVT